MTKRFIGKGKYDKKFHVVERGSGVLRRICTWRPVETQIIIGEEITCENCQVRQFDSDWGNEVERDIEL